MPQQQSRLSGILLVSRWLKNQNDQAVLALLQHFKSSLNFDSLGHLIGSLLFQYQTNLSNNNIDDLVSFSKDYSTPQPISSESKKVDVHVQSESKDNITESENKCFILSMPTDPVFHLSSFLTRRDGILLGRTCFDLHVLTSTRSFVHQTVGHTLKLDAQDFARIQDLKLDPWIMFYKCSDLELKFSRYPKSRSYATGLGFDVFYDLNKTRVDRITKYFTISDWFDPLLENVNSLAVDDQVWQLFRYTSIKKMFSLQRLNFHTGDIQMINKDDLRLELRGRSKNFTGVRDFLQRYNNLCSNANSMQHVRKFGFISVEDYKNTVSFLSLISPHYKGLTIKDDAQIESVTDLKSVFHQNLNFFESESIILNVNGFWISLLRQAESQGNLFNIDHLHRSQLEPAHHLQDLTSLRADGRVPDWLENVITSNGGTAVPEESEFRLLTSTYHVRRQEPPLQRIILACWEIMQQWMHSLIESDSLGASVRELKKCNLQHLILKCDLDKWFQIVKAPILYHVLSWTDTVSKVELVIRRCNRRIRFIGFGEPEQIIDDRDESDHERFEQIVNCIAYNFKNLVSLSIILNLDWKYDCVSRSDTLDSCRNHCSQWYDFLSCGGKKGMFGVCESLHAHDHELMIILEVNTCFFMLYAHGAALIKHIHRYHGEMCEIRVSSNEKFCKEVNEKWNGDMIFAKEKLMSLLVDNQKSFRFISTHAMKINKLE